MSSWKAVCGIDDLAEDKGKEVLVNGRPIALFLHQDKVYALDDRCPHREGQLSRGTVENGHQRGSNTDFRNGGNKDGDGRD